VFYAYVIKSVNHNYFYKGHCRDLKIRLSQHNSGISKSIRPYIPFILAYYETFFTEEEAIEREDFLKLHLEEDI